MPENTAPEKAIARIEFETQQIDRLLEEYGELLTRALRQTPDLVEVTAIASVLHSFYTGVENIFNCIAELVDDRVPSGPQSHSLLLDQMASSCGGRDAILTEDLHRQLYEYLGFRHFYRHGYSFFLEWEKMEELVEPLTGAWDQLKQQLHALARRSERP